MTYMYRHLVLSWILTILLTHCWVTSHTVGRCEIGDDGVYRFGPDCSFSCHCLNAAERCDWKTGECASGCNWAWAGQGCQYTNKAYKPYVFDTTRNIDNAYPPQYARLANDENPSTCSETGDEYTKRNTNPWWKMWFPKNITFKQLTILTKTDKLVYFRNFVVSVEHAPDYYSGVDKSYYSKYKELCYEERQGPPESTTINVKCQRPVVGNLLRIELGSIQSQLVICDIRIFEECEDGTYGETCLQNCSGNCFNNRVCLKSNGSCPNFWCNPGYKGDKCDQKCAVGYYGVQCKEHCSSYCLYGYPNCNHVDGVCTGGCKDGWKIPKCDQECENGSYGKNCVFNCTGNCLNDAVCIKSSGRCPGGCKPGFRGDTCDRECAAGYFGARCMERCSTRCLYGYQLCNHVDGKCTGGCQDGWRNPNCDQECATGYYGDQCLRKCSLYCLNNNCNHIDGDCTDGCQDGWKIPKCDKECDDGTYGKSCGDKCSGNCLNEDICVKSNGSCPRGCKPGYKEDTCNKMCPDGYFGMNCTQICSKHCIGVCDKVDGTCLRCEHGWIGINCTTDSTDAVTEAHSLQVSINWPQSSVRIPLSENALSASRCTGHTGRCSDDILVGYMIAMFRRMDEMQTLQKQLFQVALRFLRASEAKQEKNKG